MIRFLSVSYFATASPATGHFWVHNSLVSSIKLDSSSTVLRKGDAKGDLSRWFFESSTGALSRFFGRNEASKIIECDNFLDEDNQVVLFYEGGPFELFLASQLIQSTLHSRVIFNFHQSLYWSQLSWASPEVVSSLRSLLLAKRLILTAESSSLAKLLSEAIDVMVTPFPVFTTLPEQLAENDPAPVLANVASTDLHFFIVVGDVSMVAESIRFASLAAKRGFEIHVHWSGRNFDFIDTARLDGISQTSGTISSIEYANLLRRSKNLVLAYDADAYRFHSSGRVEDGLQFDSVVWVPAGTSLVFQNGNRHRSFSHLSEILEEFVSNPDWPEQQAMTTDLALELLFRRLAGESSEQDSEPFSGSFPHLPSVAKRLSLSDRLSIFRLRLGVSDKVVHPIRHLWRRVTRHIAKTSFE